jgi:hypothetical protein
MYKQVLGPGDSLFLSALVAMIPLAMLFVLLGGLKLKSHWAGLRWSRRRTWRSGPPPSASAVRKATSSGRS